jgi:hypothetical protein
MALVCVALTGLHVKTTEQNNLQVKSWSELNIQTEQLARGAAATFTLAPAFAMPGPHEIFQAIVINESNNVTIIGSGTVLDAAFRNTFFGVEGALAVQGVHFKNAFESGMAGSEAAAIRIVSSKVQNGACSLSNCSFTNCSSIAGGGAIFADCTDCEVGVFVGVTLTNCIFADNRAGGKGIAGAIEVHGNAKVHIADCAFVATADKARGHNDIVSKAAPAGSVTFDCPPGSRTTPVVMPQADWTTDMLPPTKQVVKCT